MLKEPKLPKVIYEYVEDESAVNSVYDMLFGRLLEHKTAKKQATKTPKNTEKPNSRDTIQ
mgnify:CR=1 FL=1